MRSAFSTRWFDDKEEKIGSLVNLTGIHGSMQAHLLKLGFPATEMQELHETLKKAERLLLDLQMAVFTREDTE